MAKKSINHNKKKRIVIVASQFNEYITKRLLKSCLDELSRLGISSKNTTVLWVPGSFEIPVVALKAAKNKDVDAVICLGAIIRGQTYHFELIANAAAYGVEKVSLMTGKPIIFGVLSTDTVDQAYKRSEAKGDNKGQDAANAAVAMIDLLSKL